MWTNQFDNTANRRAHVETTGPEIWEQTNGTVNAVTFATGTGGTLAGNSQNHLEYIAEHFHMKYVCLGVGTYLKSKNENIKVVLADPEVCIVVYYRLPVFYITPVTCRFTASVCNMQLHVHTHVYVYVCVIIDMFLGKCSL